MIQIGDMMITGAPEPRLLEALSVIADLLHPAYDHMAAVEKGKSKRSCVLCSLTVRDFLFRAGFRDAEVRPVATVIMEVKADDVLGHTLGIGGRNQADKPGHWPGHMVVHVAGFVIDTTLYQAQRPVWHELPGMIAVPFTTGGEPIWNMPSIAHGTLDTSDGREIGLFYLDDPKNKKWRDGPDASPRLRKPVVDFLLEQSGCK